MRGHQANLILSDMWDIVFQGRTEIKKPAQDRTQPGAATADTSIVKSPSVVAPLPSPPPLALPPRSPNPLISFERLLRRRLEEEAPPWPDVAPWPPAAPAPLLPPEPAVPVAPPVRAPAAPEPAATLAVERQRDGVAVRVTLREGPLEGAAIAVAAQPGGVTVDVVPPPGRITPLQGAELRALSRALAARGLRSRGEPGRSHRER